MKIYKAYAKVNIFLKITGKRENYHQILSRFVRIESLYDELCFVPKTQDPFRISGDFSCDLHSNTIYKAYRALLEFTHSESLEKLMRTHGVEVKKNIPAFAGLGGGSSDAACYLKMCNEVLHLNLSLNDLARIGLKIGADVPFFIYGYKSANVSGIGEIVEEFHEEPLDIEVFTPDVEISTPRVYQIYREEFYAPIDGFVAERLKKTSSLDILQSMDINEANDLFRPALQEYKELKNYYKHGYHFSGSGSSFFKIKERENG